MRTLFLLATLVAAPALGHPVVVGRETTQQQIQALAATLAGLRAQLDADEVFQRAPGGARLAHLLGRADAQVANLARQLHALPGPVRPPTFVAQPPPPRPMDDAPFADLLRAVRTEGFSDGKIRVLAQAAGAHWFVVSQLRRIIEQLPFSDEKVKAVELVAPRLLDRQNAYQLHEALTFRADKERVRRILERLGP